MAGKSGKFDFKTSGWVLCRRLIREYLRHHVGKIAFGLLCMTIVALATGSQAKMIEPALDKVLIEGDRTLVWVLPIAFLAVSVIKGFASYGQAVVMQKMGLRVIVTMQNQMFNRLIGADIKFMHSDATGKLISRFGYDVNFTKDAIVKTFTGLGRDLLTIVVLAGVMIATNWMMALIALVILPISIYPIVYIGRRMRRISANTQVSLGTFTSFLDEVFKGFRQVKAYGMEDYERKRASDVFEQLFALHYKSGRTRSRSYPIMETLGGTAIAFVLGWGGYQVLQGTATVGQFMTFLVAMAAAYQPLRSLANLNASLQHGLAAAERVFTMIDYRPTIADSPAAEALTVESGRVTLDNVHFAYTEEKAALHGVSIDAPPGKTVALVGPSGAGKSTILNLILRFFDVQDGAVRIDGQDVRDVTLESLRASIALVSQEVTLFNDTVRANILYGRPEASDADVEAAAKAAAAHDFIMEMPDGYDTLVGERGLRLSGGQRQRLAIARAMLRDAPILLLDEATSALDTEAERQVQAAVTRLMTGRTTIVIAHRLSTVANADIIYVLEGGRVVDRGTHHDLITRDGVYARLCRMQFEDSMSLGETAPATKITARA
ncbi:MAG: ABC transporter ATP-binding protein/permease [Alphaproteobacteria bacterium]|nr:ABC transporter ATP-binding protein/permease [Alphaproteobacteria bacterium]